MKQEQIDLIIENLKSLKVYMTEFIQSDLSLYDLIIQDAFEAYMVEKYGDKPINKINEIVDLFVSILNDLPLIDTLTEYKNEAEINSDATKKIDGLFKLLGSGFFANSNVDETNSIKQIELSLRKYNINQTWLIQHGLANHHPDENVEVNDFEYVKSKKGVIIKKYIGNNSIVIIPKYIDDIPVIKIDDYVFKNKKDIIRIDLPHYLESIGKDVFRGTSIISIDIPDSVCLIGEYAFSDCKKLENIKLPCQLKALKSRLFSGCTSLEKISIPNGVTSIGDYVFEGCRNLRKIAIPDSVARLGWKFIQDSKKLVVYGNDNTRIDRYVNDCYYLKRKGYNEYFEE